ncbi:tRNA-(ms[2]io[6]A)-hydroxylase [Lyngbya confervoides]|uniref:tRNA-(ms[2]io[6]A)-hydroxylase n=1 Tax=Lyngbya confervoides TaxID=207921 RepID=UPI0032D58D11
MSSSVALPKIKFLKQPTQQAWIDQAIAHIDTVLLDHSHCERKAAGMALKLMFRYPSYECMVRSLTALAQEELEHFELCNQWLERRGIAMAPLAAPPYGATLNAQIRRHEPDRFLDLMLVSALIEARSHERLGLLAAHLPDPDLAQFYRGLMASEARHYGIYWMLAHTYCDQAQIVPRLAELAEVESQVLATLHPEPRIHS